MRDELANAGLGLLLSGILGLGVVLLVINQMRGPVAPALLIGGAAGLAFTLLKPGNPARVGPRFPQWPKELSAHEQYLVTYVARRRNPWLMILANLPYFFAIIAYVAGMGPPMVEPKAETYALSGFFSFIHVGCVAWGVQYLQVLWALSREHKKGQADL